MEKIPFGKELEGNTNYGITLEDFKNLILYNLEDYLFETKFNDKVTNIDIPALGINLTTEKRYALDLRGYFNIPQFSFDTNGCLYNNGKEGAYVSPEFFGKCFIERTIDVWTSIAKLYSPRVKMDEQKDDSFGGGELGAPILKKLDHIDFVDIYNKLVGLKRLNHNLTQGLIGLLPELNDKNRILYLRKIEIAAQIQKDIEFVINEIREETYNEKAYEYSDEDFYESDEYKNLEKEHNRLFRTGPFIAPIVEPEWQSKGRIYDEGTDEERENWRKQYESLKEEYRLKGMEKIKISISKQLFSLSEIQKRVIDYLKTKIYAFNYAKVKGAPGNPLINELGLDVTSYYAHPADKYIPSRTNNRLSSYDLFEADESDYDRIYGINNDDDFDDNYYIDSQRRF